MTTSLDQIFLALLRFSLGIDESFPHRPTADEWGKLYACACRQSMVGVTFCGVSRLSEASPAAVPQQLVMQWACDTEVIAGLNDLQNRKAARLTAIFERQGDFTVESLAEALCEEYDITPATALTDVAALAAQWQQVGVVE